MEKILLSFYGDDFTGSTDVMESLALNGVPAVLFLAPPSPEELEGFRLKNRSLADESGKPKAFGVAGISRSLSPEQMDEHLPTIFEEISKIPSGFFHYKTCSTFDSSPTLGSIGHATDLAFEFFPSNFIPLLIGAPSLNRFCVFGNLFARVDDITFRLDRHPTMSKHPATPMNESDLRMHLSKQTYRQTKLFDLFALELPEEKRRAKLQEMHTEPGEFMLFDILNERHLLHAGQLISEFRQQGTQLLVGSSGMEYALCNWLQKTGKIKKPETPPSPGRAERIVAMAGSAAPATKGQIEWAMAHGFHGIRMNTEEIVQESKKTKEVGRIMQEAEGALRDGKSAVIYSALGPDDPAINQTKKLVRDLNIAKPISELLAGTQGEILKELLKRTGLKRAVVAGGDTSGYAARELGIYALETLMPIAPGAPLCLGHSRETEFDGLQISLKGGQNGNPRYFESIQAGENLPV